MNANVWILIYTVMVLMTIDGILLTVYGTVDEKTRKKYKRSLTTLAFIFGAASLYMTVVIALAASQIRITATPIEDNHHERRTN